MSSKQLGIRLLRAERWKSIIHFNTTVGYLTRQMPLCVNSATGSDEMPALSGSWLAVS